MTTLASIAGDESILFQGYVELEEGAAIPLELLMDSGATSHNFMCSSLADKLDPHKRKRKKISVKGEYADRTTFTCTEAMEINLTVLLPLANGADTTKTFITEVMILGVLTTDLVLGVRTLLDQELFEPLQVHLKRIFLDSTDPANTLATTISSKDIFPLEMVTAESGLCDLEAYPDPTNTNLIEPPTLGGSPELQQQLKSLLLEFTDVFSNTVSPVPASVTPMTLKRLGPEMPHAMRGRVRPQLGHHQEEINRQVDQLLELGVIVPCNEDHFSQVLLVGKSDGSKRMCIDFRHLNRVTEGLQWPLPIIPDLIRHIGGHKFYAVLDLTSGYHQCLLTEEASRLTAFKTSRGMFRFTRVPFGLKGAPSYFQYSMAEEVLTDYIMRICAVYIDDCVIYGDTEEEFLANLRKVLQRFKEKGILVKSKKCSFGVSSITYLGHVISETGVTFSETRKEALKDMKIPTTVTELRTFLGLAGYMRNHVKAFAEIAAPLYTLTANTKKKNSLIPWTEDTKVAYQNLKDAVYAAPMLHHLENEGKITLLCDASDIACGAHLIQEINGMEYSVYFVSKTFSATERRWSVGDREMFAQYFGITQLKSFLGGRHFTLKTDHENLKYWYSESASPKVQRWRVALSEFDFTIEHIKGELNVVADALSRLVVIAVTSDNHEDLMGKFHGAVEGHSGVRATLSKMKKSGYSWPGMAKEVAKFIKTCPICQRGNDNPRTSHGLRFSLDKPGPNQLVAMDTIGPLETDKFGYSYIVVFVDAMSRYTVLMPLVGKDTVEYARKLLEYVCNYGKPESLRSDQGGQFHSDLIKEFALLMNSSQHFSIAYSHQDNGQCERMIREVRRHLDALLMEIERPQEWSIFLPMVQRVINTKVNSSTGFAPATLKFGLDNALESDLFVKEYDAKDPQEFVTSISQLQKNLTLKYNELTAAEEGDRIDPATTFLPGTYVLVDLVKKLKNKVSGGKRSGPYRVLAQHGASVELYDPTSQMPKKVHVSRCRLFHSREGEDVRIWFVAHV